MNNFSESKKAILFNTNMMPWEKRFNAESQFFMYRKMLMVDPDTNIMIRINRYPAGYVTPWHTHHCAHGMYVMEGTLKTEDGCYGPGNFIWWP
ncbi:cupin domain-containing protein [Clostridium algoriphilum]|uniref:cupin domain-containing protein n=1 Tax=Clostridium algoriphilum TaxID=198347 RepID=UPI001CF407EF|nr:cupin domain-containing protein [Clostridium algoriphilum]MCB2292702.1 cupin domain-containing protein [Clostridium algoriphilum]